MQVYISREPRPDLGEEDLRDRWIVGAEREEIWMLRTELDTEEEAGWIDDATAHAFIGWAVAKFRFDCLGDRPGRCEAEGW